MKKTRNFPLCALSLLLLLTFFIPSNVKAQYDDVSLETFYYELSPYGDWINDSQYGRVWRPDVDQNEFRPYYSDGHWEMTRFGNTWVSDYDWGWAPFHYGRWHYAGRRGWLWVPDTNWGPAWVSWRSGGGYYGWAPLAPGMNFSTGRIPDYYWVFVPQRSIYYSSYPGYNRDRNRGIYSNTTIINNTYVYNQNRYYAGPRAEEIRRVTRQPVTIHDIRDQRSDRYGSRNNRPEVLRNTDRSGRSSTSSPSNDPYRNSDNRVQSPRPQRSTENSGGRVSNSGRSENSLSEKPTTQSTARPADQRLPASSQRSGRTYDNQESRASQSQRQAPAERQTAPEIRQAPAPREQPRVHPKEQQREQPREQQREQRPARSEPTPQPQVSSRDSRQQSSGQSRSSETQNTGSDRSSNNQGRPSRVQ